MQRRERELDLWFYFISAKVTEQPEDSQPAQHPQSLPGGEPHGNHRPCTGGRSHCSQNRHSLGWRMDSGTRPAVSAAPGNSMTLPPFTLYRSKPSAWCQPLCLSSVQFSLSRGQHFVTQWTAACQASLFITNSWRLCKLMAIESKMPSNHLILCHPLPLPPSIFLSSRIFSNKSVLRITWPKH